jgi:hypothetical protein
MDKANKIGEPRDVVNVNGQGEQDRRAARPCQ